MHLRHVFLRALTVCVLPVLAATAAAPSWKAGVARTVITPTNALWMAGYAFRNRPAEGQEMDLWAKALALEDAEGHRAIIVTLDVVGLKQPVYLGISKKLSERYHLGSEQVVLCASHTHCGPLLKGSSSDTYPISDAQCALNDAYSDQLEDKIAELVGNALADLGPARLRAGQGTAGFAVNRRNNIEKEVPNLIETGHLKGPVDHAVPVLAVSSPEGQLKAVLFGYACHNTTLNFYKWSGDYAGFAQLALERSHPEATALFFMGCGGDQNPLPRQQLTLAERYGNMLAAAVEEVLLTAPPELSPVLQTSMEMVDLQLGPAPTSDELEKRKADGNASIRRWATRLAADLKKGRPFLRSWPYPVQVWRLGSQLWITLGGEPVVDYALKFKKEFGPTTWVAGYCNEVMTYIPSARVLKEDMPPLASPRWGYEGSHALMSAGYPAYRWADDVEDRVTGAVRRLAAKVSARP